MKTKEIMKTKKFYKLGYNKNTNVGWIEIKESEFNEISQQQVKECGRSFVRLLHDSKGDFVGYGIG